MSAKATKKKLTNAELKEKELLEKLENIRKAREEATAEYHSELIKTLMKKLGTDDLDELEAFIDQVEPLVRENNHELEYEQNNDDPIGTHDDIAVEEA